MPRTIRPNSNPPRILEKRVSKKSRRRIKVVTNEWSNFHGGVGSSPKMLTPRQQGDSGERAALHWLVGAGALVSIPFGHSRDYDLIADFEGRLSRVQVKTSACRAKQRWAVTLCTRGGNQSWNGLVKRLDPTQFDHLFVLVADGRQWFIAADRIEGATTIHLGGPKYGEYEVEAGDPIPGCSGEESLSRIAS
jgi:hypothetical protein